MSTTEYFKNRLVPFMKRKLVTNRKLMLVIISFFISTIPVYFFNVHLFLFYIFSTPYILGGLWIMKIDYKEWRKERWFKHDA